MLNTNRTLNDIIQHALTLHHDEREKFLDQELSTDITLRKRISDFIIEVEQRQSTKTKQDDTTVLPTAKPSQANPNTATRKSWASYFYSDWKQLLVIGLLIGMTSLCGYFCFEYFQTKNKLSQTSEEQRQLLYSQIEKLRNSYQRANKSVYHHIANQNANLFVKFVYGYIPANAEQLDHLRVIARGFNSAHVEELVLAGDSTPQTLCYLAAWHWGMGEGFRRIKEYPKSLEPLKKALEFAESGFGPVDSITLSIRKDMVMSLHFADKHDEAKSVLNTGDQYCRAAIAADPSLLSNTNPDQITSWWGKLLALAVMLPPESDGAPFEEKLWKNRIEICKQIPRSDHEVFVPTYEHGFSDFFQLFMKEDRPEDVERVLRRQLAVSLPVTDLGPRNWNDRESATLALAIHLCKSPQGQFQETETLLNSVYPRLIALLNKDVRVDLTNRKYLMEHKDINLGDCIRAYIDMYDRWDKPNESMKWKREYAEYNKKLREKYPKMVIPK